MVDGRTTTGKIVNQLKQQPPRDHGENRTPIATDMYLPNLSGVATHPEAIYTFGRLDFLNTWTAENRHSAAISLTSANGINFNFNGPAVNVSEHVINFNTTSNKLIIQSNSNNGANSYPITLMIEDLSTILDLTTTGVKISSATNTDFPLTLEGTSVSSTLAWLKFNDNGSEFGKVHQISGYFGFSGTASAFTGLTAATDFVLVLAASISYVTSGTHLFTGKIFGNGEVEIDGALNHDGTTIGFYGIAPTTRPAAYTQTYSTATRTHAAVTSLAAVDTNGTFGFALVADRTAIITAINAIRTDLANLKQLVNSIIDDLQLNGILQ